MQAFSTFGTDYVIQNIMNKHQNIPFHLFSTGHELLLYYEGHDSEVFNSGQAYNVKKQIGSIPNTGFVVIQHFSLLEDHYDLFEKRAKSDLESVVQLNGFLTGRILQRIYDRGYVIMTVWENKTSYQNCLDIAEFKENILTNQTSYQHIINQAFTKYYYIIEEEK